MHKIEKLVLLLLLAASLISAGACASRGGKDYSNEQQRKAMTIRRGNITAVRTVKTSNPSSGVGSITGGIAGGVLGSQIGGGSGRIFGAVGGALGGAAAGAGAEKVVRDHDALELTIMLDNGQEIVVVQDPDDTFRPGDRVRVLSAQDGTVRVQRE